MSGIGIAKGPPVMYAVLLARCDISITLVLPVQMSRVI